MNISNNNHLNILDFSDEVLLIILNKLNIVDVLYSLVNVNKRFDQIALDPLYIRHLDMTILTINSVFDRTFSIDNQVLDTICDTIFPRIHHQIHKLTVEQHSMDRLLSIDYPQLHSLSLIDFQEPVLLEHLTGNATLRNLLTEQITDLTIDIRHTLTIKPSCKIVSNIFASILSLCNQLINLNFCELCPHRSYSIFLFKLPSTSCMSSTLTTLKVNVRTFKDCLYLLDGRLGCLATLIIFVRKIRVTLTDVDNTKKLPQLKCFSLRSIDYARGYDTLIILLLRRMINLEELKLFLSVIKVDSTHIDGIQLHDEILIHMPRLNKFTFSINTGVVIKNIRMDLPSNQDFQRSFIGRGYGHVGSYIDTYVMEAESRSHIYSLPYEFGDFLHLNNSFQGGMFVKVRYLMMTDGFRPFEHNFFQVISEAFPFLQELCICNNYPQKDKQHSSTLIAFPHLWQLSLGLAHMDYVEQFLFDKNTHLPRLLHLDIEYEQLAMVTNNFSDDAARLNCANLKTLAISEPFVRPENFHQYFPLLS